MISDRAAHPVPFPERSLDRFLAIDLADPVLRHKLRIAARCAGVSEEAFIIDLLRDALGDISAQHKGTTS